MDTANVRILWRVLPVLPLLVVCGCASHGPSRTVDLDAINRLKADGVMRAEVTSLLGSPRGPSTTTDRGLNAFYFVKVRDSAAAYRNRAPLSEEDKKFHGASFGFDANQKVYSVWANGGGKLDEAPASAFKMGGTTKDQVYGAYGYPDSLNRNPDGSTTASYSYASPSPFVTNSANNTFEGRRYLESRVFDKQDINITFDAKGVIQELTMHFGVETNYQFTPFYQPGRSDAPFDEGNIVKAKLNRLSVREACQLFGEPERITLRSWGESEYQFQRNSGDAAKGDFKIQSLTMSFGPDQLAKMAMSFGTGPNASSKTVEHRHIVLNVMLALSAVANHGPTTGPTTSRESESQSGTKVDPKVLGSIQVGKSTPSDIAKLIGVPDYVFWNEDGSMSYNYSYSQSSSRSGTGIYMFGAKSTAKGEFVGVKFDPAGFLKEITSIKSTVRN